jgi:hypothetical protein
MGNKGEFVQSIQDVFSATPCKWDLDQGSVPTNVSEGEVIFTSFQQDDVAIYTDVVLSGRYNKEEGVDMEVTYKTEGDAQGNLHLIYDYMLTESGNAPSGTFVEQRSVNAHSTTGITQLTIEGVLPTMENIADNSIVTFRFGRLGADAGDTLVGGFEVLSVRFFQKGF